MTQTTHATVSSQAGPRYVAAYVAATRLQAELRGHYIYYYFYYFIIIIIIKARAESRGQTGDSPCTEYSCQLSLQM